MNVKLFKLSALFVAVLMAQAATAIVKPASIFSDNMVLQQHETITVWGWADKHERVKVSFNGKTVATKADKEGKWSVDLAPLSYGGPYVMEISGKSNVVTFENVLIGEVWLCSGQSNMEWRVRDSNHAKTEIENANHPTIRSFNVERGTSIIPLNDVKGSWEVCSPATVGNFSAVAYFFAQKLNAELGVPIGIINSSWGGTDIETWMSKEVLKSLPERYVSRYQNLNFEVTRTTDTGYAEYGNPNAHPTLLYNAMIHPITSYTIKGVIWYQGCNNVRAAYDYCTLFPEMIKDWRAKWGYDFPFYWVQLANYLAKDATPRESDWAELRMAQTLTLSLPKTGQAVITDIGEAHDIHPRNKQDVGKRLALNALHKDYGKTEVVYSGPTFNSMEIRNSTAVISFDNIEEGLLTTSKYGYVEGFAIAGADKEFKWATARIVGDKVIVSSSEVNEPIAVRYAWSNNPDVNLYNKQGLPAVPFKTDDWQWVTFK